LKACLFLCLTFFIFYLLIQFFYFLYQYMFHLMHTYLRKDFRIFFLCSFDWLLVVFREENQGVKFSPELVRLSFEASCDERMCVGKCKWNNTSHIKKPVEFIYSKLTIELTTRRNSCCRLITTTLLNRY